METTFDAVILANGPFPVSDVPLGILRSASLVVACDGAVRHFPQAHVVIGDGDSVPTCYHDRLIRVDEQDDNDLTKATRYCIGRGAKRIAYVGATGGREDHTLGNLSLMVRYRRDFGVEPTLFTDTGWFTVAQGETHFTSVPGQQVSIFNFGCTRLESEGLKWQSYAYREWWQGTLNEALDRQFTLRADGRYLVYRTYLPKQKPSTVNN